MIVQENIQHAIIGKFSYGKSDIMEMQKQVPVKYRIKRDYNIGIFDTRDILIQLNILGDY